MNVPLVFDSFCGVTDWQFAICFSAVRPPAPPCAFAVAWELTGVALFFLGSMVALMPELRRGFLVAWNIILIFHPSTGMIWKKWQTNKPIIGLHQDPPRYGMPSMPAGPHHRLYGGREVSRLSPSVTKWMPAETSHNSWHVTGKVLSSECEVWGAIVLKILTFHLFPPLVFGSWTFHFGDLGWLFTCPWSLSLSLHLSIYLSIWSCLILSYLI